MNPLLARAELAVKGKNSVVLPAVQRAKKQCSRDHLMHYCGHAQVSIVSCHEIGCQPDQHSMCGAFDFGGLLTNYSRQSVAKLQGFLACKRF